MGLPIICGSIPFNTDTVDSNFIQFIFRGMNINPSDVEVRQFVFGFYWDIETPYIEKSIRVATFDPEIV